MKYDIIQMYHTENEIVKIDKILKRLKGMIILDSNDDFFIFKDYFVESVTFKKGFLKKKNTTKFYIKWLELKDGKTNKVIRHSGDEMCTLEGVKMLISHHERWMKLQDKLIDLSISSGLPLNFSSMVKRRIGKD